MHVQNENGIYVSIHKPLKLFDLDVEFHTSKCVLGILGPSGCGKSMTLKSIAGIAVPSGGKIVLNPDSDRRHVLYDSAAGINVKPQKRRIGYLFQNYALFPNMTVAQNILAGLGGSVYTGKGTERKERNEILKKMIERFRLQGLEHQYPRQLSGGQQQRAALARIMAYEPEALLLDEPFSAMDTFLRESLRLELASVLREYKGISIMVTHDRDEAYQLCDQLMLMHEGKVIAAGPTQMIFEHPETVQAAILTGCKNISRIRRIGEYRVRALDWDNLELNVGQRVEDEITHIGIRAHDLYPVSEEALCAGSVQESLRCNVIPVRNPKVNELPFEWYIILEQKIWWKVKKEIHDHDPAVSVPGALAVDPEAIMLLKE